MSSSSIDEGEVPESVKYSQVTRGIAVTAQPFPLLDESDPPGAHFVFGYKITIENIQDRPVQLLERHWLVYSAEILAAEIVGPGVVGEQPVIEPGQSFSYQSAAVIDEPVGSMVGSYTMRYVQPVLAESVKSRGEIKSTEAGSPVAPAPSSKELYLSVAIPRFSLVFPQQFH